MIEHCEILRVMRHNRYLDLGKGSNKFGNHCCRTSWGKRVNLVAQSNFLLYTGYWIFPCLRSHILQYFLKSICVCGMMPTQIFGVKLLTVHCMIKLFQIRWRYHISLHYWHHLYGEFSEVCCYFLMCYTFLQYETTCSDIFWHLFRVVFGNSWLYS